MSRLVNVQLSLCSVRLMSGWLISRLVNVQVLMYRLVNVKDGECSGWLMSRFSKFPGYLIYRLVNVQFG